jgi:hypothetical protein
MTYSLRLGNGGWSVFRNKTAVYGPTWDTGELMDWAFASGVILCREARQLLR